MHKTACFIFFFLFSFSNSNKGSTQDKQKLGILVVVLRVHWDHISDSLLSSPNPGSLLSDILYISLAGSGSVGCKGAQSSDSIHQRQSLGPVIVSCGHGEREGRGLMPNFGDS